MRTMATVVCVLGLLSLPVAVFPHGTEYEVLSSGVVGVRAMYDGGQPMGNARTLIFAPGDGQVSWETQSDARGIVCFSPDRSGLWVIQVRAEGGHGMRINLQVDDAMVARSEASGAGRLAWYQKTLIAASVIWGMAGTALFFRGRSAAGERDT